MQAATRAFSTAAKGLPQRSSGSVVGLVGFGSLCAGTFGLGVWQTKRYFEKFEMTEKRCKDLEKEPLNAWELVASLPRELNPRDVPSRRVTLSGTYDNTRVALIGPRPPPKDFPRELLGADTAGFLLVTPFVDEAGREILVHRGWLPRTQAQPDNLAHILKSFRGHMTISGVLRGSENMANSLGADSGGETIITVHIPQLAERLKLRTENDLADPTLAMIEEIRPLHRGDVPYTKQLEAFRDFFTTPVTHITYAATWYTLAIIGAVLTRRMFLPSRGARVHNAIENYMVKQDSAKAAASKKAAGLFLAGTAGMPLVTPPSQPAQRIPSIVPVQPVNVEPSPRR